MIVRRQGGLTEFIPSPQEKREGILRDHTLDLLANLYRRADERAGELAQIADDARRRGSACEAIHDADRRTLNGEGGDAQTR